MLGIRTERMTVKTMIDNVSFAVCDMNQDGEVDTTDYKLLRNYVMCI